MTYSATSYYIEEGCARNIDLNPLLLANIENHEIHELARMKIIFLTCNEFCGGKVASNGVGNNNLPYSL